MIFLTTCSIYIFRQKCFEYFFFWLQNALSIGTLSTRLIQEGHLGWYKYMKPCKKSFSKLNVCIHMIKWIEIKPDTHQLPEGITVYQTVYLPVMYVWSIIQATHVFHLTLER